MSWSRSSRAVALALLGLVTSAGCASKEAPTAPAPRAPANGPDTVASAPSATQDTSAGPRGPAAGPQPRPYSRVITRGAVSDTGLFRTHRIGERLYFEIPGSELGRDQLVVSRTVQGSASAGMSRVVTWERAGNRILLRQRSHAISADSTTAIYQAVSALNAGPIVAAFNVEAWSPDSAAVIDVTRLFTSNIAEFAAVNGVAADRSFLNAVHAFPINVNVEATQTGSAAPAPASPGAPAAAGARAATLTVRQLWSFRRLPDPPMRPRLADRRVGIITVQTIDYGRPEHEATTREFIRRYRLEKRDPAAAVSDPVEPIVFYIDRATPEWLVPWIRSGIEKWEPAYREAGFSNAIQAKLAPSPAEDPKFSVYDARYNVIYWRPSEVANASGGQVVDPRTGEILKAEVNMYHNVMQLLRDWYFTQVSPLDQRARRLPLPDSLMGRLVEYVVTHEVGHAIGFPHNFKASSLYPVDSLRSASFLRRMGGHVATLMDYSRFNYVAQPEDSIPVDLLIPGVGPYDRFAIKWQNTPIPGARTPDEEWPTLDGWSRQQDTIPWFRFSTTDATGDAGNITEAVGDADAVKASTLALRNLERVAGSLLAVAEQPGRDYRLLTELYGSVVDQWSRYNGHVAAIVGSADSQERYGTGIRFTPTPQSRQRQAVQFLADHAFRVPPYLLDRELLRRMEQEGVVNRIRAAQANVLNTLFAGARLNRLVEDEALARRGEDTYTVAELLGDVRRAVWAELGAANPRIDPYRRNLQRAYLETAARTIAPPATTATVATTAAAAGSRAGGDARAVLRGELAELDRAAAAAIARTGDAMTRLHLRDVRMEIERILEPRD